MGGKSESAERADPFAGDFDVTGFKPAPPKKPVVAAEAIRKVSEEQNFPSRSAPKKPPARPQRRHRTGRNVQLNIKATPQTVERFVKIAERENLVLGELLSRALDAFEAARPAK